MDFICGINAVYEALRAGRRVVKKVYIAEGKREAVIAKILEAASKCGVKVLPVSREKIAGLVYVEKHQGVVAEVESFKYSSLEDVITLGKKSTPFIVILDQINDPHNLGAVIRTAYLTGADGIIIPKDNAAQIGPTVAKAASGALEYLPISKVVNINSAINILKDNNIWVVGADDKSTKNVFEYDFTTGTAVVLGGEGKGLRRLVSERCDELLTIPMKGHTLSYNVSVAGAIFMSEIMRQRLARNVPKTPKSP